MNKSQAQCAWNKLHTIDLSYYEKKFSHKIPLLNLYL